MALKLKIITPSGIFFDGDVESVTVKTTEGFIGIYEWHTPLIASLQISPMLFYKNGVKSTFSVNGGLVSTNFHEVRIISDNVEAINQDNVNADSKNSLLHEATRSV